MTDATRLVNGRNIRHGGSLISVQLPGALAAMEEEANAVVEVPQASDVFRHYPRSNALSNRVAGTFEHRTQETFGRVTITVANVILRRPRLVRLAFDHCACFDCIC